MFLSAAPTGIHHSDEFANKVKLWDFDTSQGKDLYLNGWVQHFFGEKSLNINKIFSNAKLTINGENLKEAHKQYRQLFFLFKAQCAQIRRENRCEVQSAHNI